jgi:hypothetical protein
MLTGMLNAVKSFRELPVTISLISSQHSSFSIRDDAYHPPAVAERC